MTGFDLLDPKTLMILEAIDEAGRSLNFSEIIKRVDLPRQSVIGHVNWRMLHKWLRVEKEETDRNQRPIRYFGITPEGYARMEAM